MKSFTPDCVIFGEETLTIQCAEVLLEKGVHIQGVVSSDLEVREWAEKNKVNSMLPESDIILFLKNNSCKYIFSIVNAYIPEDIFERGDITIINYHNALLPYYAGFHATSHALRNQESRYGITWHEMVNMIDAGPIYEQVSFSIDENETCFTLNGKCYDAAISSFKKLIDALLLHQNQPYPQDLTKRTFYPMYMRPYAGGVIQWEQSANSISAFVRSLDFGPYPNLLSLPKIIVNGTFLLTPRVEKVVLETTNLPGTIISIQDESLLIATNDGAIEISEIYDIDGRIQPISDIISQFDLTLGQSLDIFPADISERLTLYTEMISKYEGYWHEELLSLNVLSPPYIQNTHSFGQTVENIGWETVRFALPHIGFSQENHLYALLASLLGYFGRLSGEWNYSIGLRDALLEEEIINFNDYFMQTVPFSIKANATWSFNKMFECVRKKIERTRLNKTYPRDMIARYPRLRSQLQLYDNPLFPITVQFGLGLRKPFILKDSLLVIAFSRETSEIEWQFRSGVLTEENIKMMHAQFSNFRENTAKQPKAAFYRFAIPSKNEIRKIKLLSHSQSLRVPAYCIHRLFEAQVKLTPEAIAISKTGHHQQWTYRKLDSFANRIAHKLIEIGVRSETFVGLLADRSPEMVAGMLGILKAGGAYVPLDPDYPPKRLEFMLHDSQPRVILTQKKFLNKEILEGRLTLSLDSKRDFPTTSQRSPLSASLVVAENLAYMIYTSGTTGNPKGVMVSHQALYNHMKWMQSRFPLQTEDRVLQKTPFSFDASIWEFYAPLLSGAQLILSPPKSHQDPSLLIQTLINERITILQVVPQLLKALLDDPKFAYCTQLRRVFCGGESINYDIQKRFLETFKAELCNLYGPTESCIDTTFWVCTPSDSQGSSIIGRPISHVSVYILDPYYHLVPLGLPGEIFIGGAGLARAYHNNAALTATRFVPDSISREKGKRLYRTGDYGRLRPDGAIEYLGRHDQQIKLKGLRVELDEVAALLQRHHAVSFAVVIGIKSSTEYTYLVAYYTNSVQFQVSPTELRDWLKQFLPVAIIPRAFVHLENIPLLPNGKLDRNSLPPHNLTDLPLNGHHVDPHTILETIIKEMWESLLGLSDISVEDSFFDLGGDSLLAIQFIARVRQQFQVEIPLHMLFLSSNVAKFAQALEEAIINSIDALSEEEALRQLEAWG